MEARLERMSDQVKKVDIQKISAHLLEAVRLLAVYDTKIKDSKIKKFYLPRLEQIEAISSMKIEGTQTTMSDVIASDVFPDPKNSDLTEVFNHNIAVVKGSRAIQIDGGFTDQNIKDLHKTMLTGIKHRNKNSILGEYKSEDNKIVSETKTVIYYPPHYYEVQGYMDDLITFMNSAEYVYHPLVNAALLHSQFESIHPFDDGNGRIGRMLIPLYLFKTKVINTPMFYISEAIEKDKIQYYRNLTNSRTSDMNLWINYFLRKCIDQSNKHIKYFQDLEVIHHNVSELIKNNVPSQKNMELIDALFAYPQLTAKKLSDVLTVSRAQAIRYLRTLESLGILYPDEKIRNTSYYFEAYLRLLTE